MVSMIENGRTDSLVKARQARLDKASNTVTTTEKQPQDRLSRLDPTRRAAVADRLSQMPRIHRNAYLRGVGGKSPASGIKAFCNECIGWERGEVAACTALACPLWSYRPSKV